MASLFGYISDTELYYGDATPPPPLEGSFAGSTVFGVNTTVVVTRAIAFGLDGNTNVHNEEGKFKVFGDGAVTGTLVVDGGTIGNISTMLDALGE